MTSRSRLLVGVAGVVALTACDGGPGADLGRPCTVESVPPVGPVQLTTDRGEYAPPADIRVTLWNGAGGPIGYNLCFSELQRCTGDAWVRVPWAGSGVACPAVMYQLDAGRSAATSLEVSASALAGKYRVLHEIEVLGTGERRPVASAPFVVR